MKHAFLRGWRAALARADRSVLALAGVLWFAGALVPQPEASRFVREEVRILPAEARYTLAVTILRPRGDGPFGAIILNHGAPGTAAARGAESPALFLHTASAFAQRGYAVFMPMRRGFGATGGTFAEDSGSCSDPDFHGGERAAAADVLAAYDFARKLPYVERSRILLAGQSAGGIASLYAAAQRPDGVAAVLAFAAGRGADPGHPGVPCAAERLAAVFEYVGRSIQAPVLLHYAENDRSFGPATSQLWFRKFKAAGATAEYLLQPPFGADGHYVFSDRDGIRVWLPGVERFLQRHGIPFETAGQRA
jgi:dienelactone hydrolase